LEEERMTKWLQLARTTAAYREADNKDNNSRRRPFVANVPNVSSGQTAKAVRSFRSEPIEPSIVEVVATVAGPQVSIAQLADRDAPACPSDVFERAAIIEEREGCYRATAEAKALAEFGFASVCELANALGAYILARSMNCLRAIPRTTTVASWTFQLPHGSLAASNRAAMAGDRALRNQSPCSCPISAISGRQIDTL
jgi:hypothetical protein